MRIPIKELKELSNKCGLTHCIVFGFDSEKVQQVATFGHTIEACSQAADFGNKLKTALGWPENLHAQPARVRKLQARIKELEEQLSDLNKAYKELDKDTSCPIGDVTI